MSSTTLSLNDELIDYLITHGSEYLSRTEVVGLSYASSFADLPRDEQLKTELVAGLHRNGGFVRVPGESLGEFKQRVARRIFRGHACEFVKFCPQCDGLLNAPDATECRHCEHAWSAASKAGRSI